jgi:hypothetical protein
MVRGSGRRHGGSQEVDTVLSSEEERIWQDVQRFWTTAEAEEPPLPQVAASDAADVPVAVVAGVSVTILLLLFGAVVAAVAIATASALGWALWRRWQGLEQWGASVRPGSFEDSIRRWPAPDRWAD